MDLRKVEGNEATQVILNILKTANQPLTTREVQEETQKQLVRCPDTTAVFLNRLRSKGLIKGERSREKRGFIWWID